MGKKAQGSPTARHSKSLNRIILGSTLGAGGIIILASCILLWLFWARAFESQLELRARSTMSAFLVTARKALVHGDQASLASLTSEILEETPGLVGLTVFDPRGDVLLSRRGVDADPTAMMRVKRYLPIGENLYARIDMEFSRGAYRKTLMVGLAILAITVAAMVSLFGWILVRRLNHRVVEPVRELKNLAKVLARGGEVPMDAGLGVSEFHEVRESVIEMATEIRKQDEALHLALKKEVESNARLLVILNNIQTGIILTTPEGELLVANQAARRLLPPEAFQTPLLHGWLDRRRVDHLFGLRLPLEAENELTGLMLRLEVVPVHSTDGSEQFGALVVIRDVTEEAALTRAKDEFLSTVSHELRTPLTSIRSFSEILLTEISKESTEHEFAEVIHEECLKLGSLVDKMLDVALMREGRLQFDIAEVDLEECVLEVAKPYVERAKQKGVEFSINVSPLLVRADRHWLEDALEQLLDNAIKFCPKDSWIKVEARLKSKVGDVVRLSVGNGGEQIPEYKRRSLFTFFEQGGDVMTNKPSGTGIGLAYARGLIEGMGGLLVHDDSVQEGVRFCIFLPGNEAPVPVTA